MIDRLKTPSLQVGPATFGSWAVSDVDSTFCVKCDFLGVTGTLHAPMGRKSGTVLQTHSMHLLCLRDCSRPAHATPIDERSQARTRALRRVRSCVEISNAVTEVRTQSRTVRARPKRLSLSTLHATKETTPIRKQHLPSGSTYGKIHAQAD